ncbi:MAG TPA: hypothetical protein VFA07_06115 [Chthonomonadaceae bacterium]|nr:hypothetical protein [Chthonomonadaceae bacterium]
MNTVRLPESLREKMREIARRKGLTVSDVHRLALEEYCLREAEPPQQSRYDDIIGIVEGPSDLSARHKEIFEEILQQKYAPKASDA